MRSSFSGMKHSIGWAVGVGLASTFLIADVSAASQVGLVARTLELQATLCGAPTSGEELSTQSCGIGGLGAAEMNQSALQTTHDELGSAGSDTGQTSTSQVGAQRDRLEEVRTSGARRETARSAHWSNPNRIPSIALSFGSSGEGGGRLGGYLNGSYSTGEVGGRGEEIGYDISGGGIDAGIDYRVSDNLVAGAGFGWNQTTDKYASRGGGQLEQNSYAGSVYGTYFQDQFYVDGVFSYSRVDYELERVIAYDLDNTGGIAYDEVARADNSANQYALAANGGYQFSFDGLTVGPTGHLDWVRTDINVFQESGALGQNLAYDAQSIDSLIMGLGLEGAYAISTGMGVFSPSLRVSWEHEYLNDSRAIRAVYVQDTAENAVIVNTQSPDRNYAHLSLGVAGQFQNGIAVFVNYQTVLGLSQVDLHTISFGGRLEF